MSKGFPGGAEVKASACNVGDPASIPGLGRSPGEGNGNPLQYSCLENPMDGGAWWATVHGSQSRTRLSDFTSLLIDSSVFPLAASRGRTLILPQKLFRAQPSSTLCPTRPLFFRLNTSTFLHHSHHLVVILQTFSR